MKLIKGLLIFSVLVLLIVVGGLTYFGFMPVLSSVFGTDKPRDLGVQYSKADFDSFVAKGGSELIALPDTSGPKTVTYEGSKPLTTSLTGPEISARISYSPWKYMPVTNVQVKISPDGTVEASGTLVTSRIAGFLSQVGNVSVTEADVEKGLSALGIISSNPPVYVRGTGSAADNTAAISISAIEVGRLSVPLDKVPASQILTQLANQLISQANGLTVKSASFEGGQFHFDGTVPEKLYSVHGS